MKNVYGLTSLMEAIQAADKEVDTVNEIGTAVNESASFLDIGQKFVSADEVEQDMDVDDDYVSPEEDAELDELIELIGDDDDDEDQLEDSLESFEETLENYI